MLVTPTRDLRRDHEIILKVINAMDILRTLLKEHNRGNNNALNANLLDIINDTVDFAKNFTDRCHHEKEEHVLFPALNNVGMPKDEGPIAVMIREHKQAREIIDRIESSIEGYKQGRSSINDILQCIEEYIMLMQQHIFKENNILFNIADMMLTGKGDEINNAYSKIEHDVMQGKHEYYEHMADVLISKLNKS